VRAIGAMDQPGTLASGEDGVVATTALQVPEHADHAWVNVFPVGFFAVFVLSERSVLGRCSLGQGVGSLSIFKAFTILWVSPG
jgi:hypothetical protein